MARKRQPGRADPVAEQAAEVAGLRSGPRRPFRRQVRRPRPSLDANEVAAVEKPEIRLATLRTECDASKKQNNANWPRQRPASRQNLAEIMVLAELNMLDAKGVARHRKSKFRWRLYKFNADIAFPLPTQAHALTFAFGRQQQIEFIGRHQAIGNSQPRPTARNIKHHAFN